MKIMKELMPYLLIIAIVIVIRTFIVTPVKVEGSSMDNTLKNGQVLILNKTSHNYHRFDIVVVNVKGKKIVKRIIGMPGESIEYKDHKLYINGEVMDDAVTSQTYDFTLEKLYGIQELPDDYYFVMGDNRPFSSDSRDPQIGLVKKSNIEGIAVFRIWPLNKFGKIK